MKMSEKKNQNEIDTNAGSNPQLLTPFPWLLIRSNPLLISVHSNRLQIAQVNRSRVNYALKAALGQLSYFSVDHSVGCLRK